MIFYFIVFIVNTVTCSVWRYICCLALFIVKLINLFIMFRFFLLPDILFWWNKDMEIDVHLLTSSIHCCKRPPAKDDTAIYMYDKWQFRGR